MSWCICYDSLSGENMDDCLQYVGGTVGAVTLSSVAAATAYYYATRPSPQIPLVPLDAQSPILDVSLIIILKMINKCVTHQIQLLKW